MHGTINDTCMYTLGAGTALLRHIHFTSKGHHYTRDKYKVSREKVRTRCVKLGRHEALQHCAFGKTYPSCTRKPNTVTYIMIAYLVS